jgi:hypothetical protein
MRAFPGNLLLCGLQLSSPPKPPGSPCRVMPVRRASLLCLSSESTHIQVCVSSGSMSVGISSSLTPYLHSFQIVAFGWRDPHQAEPASLSWGVWKGTSFISKIHGILCMFLINTMSWTASSETAKKKKIQDCFSQGLGIQTDHKLQYLGTEEAYFSQAYRYCVCNTATWEWDQL